MTLTRPSIASLRRLALVAGTLLLGPAAQAQGMLHYWQGAGGFPNAYLRAAADWSSDLGADYRYGNAAAAGSMVWSGEGTHAGDADGDLTLHGETVTWELARRGGAVGQTYSGGEFQVAPSLALTGGAVHASQLHLWSVLGANDAGYGISTDATMASFVWASSGAQALAPLYFRIDWQVASALAGAAFQTLALSFAPEAGLGPISLVGDAGSVSGVLPASSYWYTSFSQYATLSAMSSVWDNAGAPGSGRVDLWAQVYLSRDPIAVVPEPGAGWLFAAGLLGLALRRLNRSAAARRT